MKDKISYGEIHILNFAGNFINFWPGTADFLHQRQTRLLFSFM